MTIEEITVIDLQAWLDRLLKLKQVWDTAEASGLLVDVDFHDVLERMKESVTRSIKEEIEAKTTG